MCRERPPHTCIHIEIEGAVLVILEALQPWPLLQEQAASTGWPSLYPGLICVEVQLIIECCLFIGHC